jgi:chromosome segregation ATPase
VSIDLNLLRAERDKLKESLRETEAELRRLEADLKGFRQREIQVKREIEALSTLIDISESREPKPDA